jgi:hypothetical protein
MEGRPALIECLIERHVRLCGPLSHHGETLITMNFGGIHFISRIAYAQQPITAAFPQAL